MKIGVYGAEGGGGDVLGALAADVRRAEAQGFASYWLPQWMSVDALTVLSLLAREAPRVELGTAVVPMHGRHPLVLAMQALTAQAATSGRLQLGLGLSHRPVVEDQMGLSFERPARYTREYLEALEALMETGEARVRGELLRCEARIHRLSESPPPILFAALGPRMLELAGRATAGTLLWLAGPRVIREHVVPTIRRAAETASRAAPRIVAGLPICVTEDPSRARDAMRRAFGTTAAFPSYQGILEREGVSGPEDVALIGDESEVARGIEALAGAGATEFVARELCPTEDDARRTRSFLEALLAA